MPRSVKGRLLPIKTIHRIMMSEGDNKKRVSVGASTRMSEILAEICQEITDSAYELVFHAGRKTIKARDVELAYKLRKM